MRAFLSPRPGRAGARVGATYTLPLASLTPDELAAEQARLTLQARSGGYGEPPPPFRAWRVDETTLHVPRFYGLERWGTPPAEADDRVDGAPVALSFQGTLTPVQTRAMAAVFRAAFAPHGPGGSIVSLPCGYGKTVFSVALAARLGRAVAVLVNKAVLRDQWMQSFRRFCPGVAVAFLGGDLSKKQLEAAGVVPVEQADVVIAMVLTLAKRDDVGDMDRFGLIVCDEVGLRE
jgi:hypothetical protein